MNILVKNGQAAIRFTKRERKQLEDVHFLLKLMRVNVPSCGSLQDIIDNTDEKGVYVPPSIKEES